MVPTVFPVMLIWFQFFFLLIAVAIEAYIFSMLVGLGRKKALFYAAFINLIATIIGWIIFFLILPLLPQDIKLQLIGYIFFDKLFYQQGSSINPALALALTAIVIFFSGLTIKLRTFQLLQIWLTTPKTQIEGRKESTLVGGQARSPSVKDKAKIALKIIIFGRLSSSKKKLIKSKTAPAVSSFSRRRALQAILKAHAASHSAILLILFLRSQVLNSREKSK